MNVKRFLRPWWTSSLASLELDLILRSDEAGALRLWHLLTLQQVSLECCLQQRASVRWDFLRWSLHEGKAENHPTLFAFSFVLFDESNCDLLQSENEQKFSIKSSLDSTCELIRLLTFEQSLCECRDPSPSSSELWYCWVSQPNHCTLLVSVC